MEVKYEIISTQFIKPSSATPRHLKDFKLSFLDQLSSYHNVPYILFYSASDVSNYNTNFTSLCDKLRTSLSDMLTIYYPLCGRVKRNSYIDCNDAGVLFNEARVSTNLATILENPQVNVLTKLLPIDAHEPAMRNTNYEELVIMEVQVSELSCGAIALGVCILHKIVDGIAAASFLNAWAEAAKVNGKPMKPHMEASSLFPTKDFTYSNPYVGYIDNKGVMTARLVFDGTSLSKLKAEMDGYITPTRVEAVTALIWRSIMEARLKGQKSVRSFASHAVNIRNRIVPPVPELSIGNFVQFSNTSMVELQVDKSLELYDLAMMLRKAIMGLDTDHVSKLVGDAGFDKVMEFRKEMMLLNSEGVIWPKFSSWTRFPLYDVNFGWGNPTWVTCVIYPVIDNYILLMATKCGKGIEAWVNLDEKDMIEFEHNPKLLQYASVSRASA